MLVTLGNCWTRTGSLEQDIKVFWPDLLFCFEVAGKEDRRQPKMIRRASQILKVFESIEKEV